MSLHSYKLIYSNREMILFFFCMEMKYFHKLFPIHPGPYYFSTKLKNFEEKEAVALCCQISSYLVHDEPQKVSVFMFEYCFCHVSFSTLYQMTAF